MSDLTIDAVKAQNAGYKNTDYSKRALAQLGSAKLYVVSFKGQDGNWYENYACEARNKVFAAATLERLLLVANNSIFPSYKEPEIIKLLVVSGLAAMFSIATVIEVFMRPDNPSIQILSGTAALLIGYLVGKGGNSN